MWRKREQVVLWFIAYLPLILIMSYRFIDSNDYFKKTRWAVWLGRHVDKTIFDVLIITGIVVFSLVIYRLVANWFFNDFDQQLKQKEIGKEVSIRKYERLSVNDYSFFLMTLLLPLISIDHASVINLTVTFLVIVIVIVIYVNTDTMSVCPVFFVSGRRVFRGIISDQCKEVEALNPSVRHEVVLITRERSLNLNNKFRTVKLIGNIHYMSSTYTNVDAENQ